MTIFGDAPPPGDILWYKAHGLLLYTAFGVLFPLGVVGVRYARYHPKFAHWFQFHWFFQSLGVFLSTGAVSIALRMFVNTKDTLHGTIGVILTLIILGQPIFALFRPEEYGSDYRRFWEFSHWFVGTGGIILGWINIFKGLDLYFIDWPGAGSQLILTVLFAVQISIIGFSYLLFDRSHREKAVNYSEPSAVVPLLTKSALKDGQFLTNV